VKTFTVRIDKNAARKAIKQMRRSIRTGISHIKDDELTCDSLESAFQVLSKARFEVFGAILDHKPKSLAALAKALGKDQANVFRDVRSLEALGLIKLTREKDGSRQRFRPVTQYDKITFDFGAFPQQAI
jgi:predicted transcriptional regulator